MSFNILLSNEAQEVLTHLRSNPHFNKEYKAVNKAITYLQANPRHPSLKTHKFESLKNLVDGPVFEAYAQNHTPGAYRIFWCYTLRG